MALYVISICDRVYKINEALKMFTYKASLSISKSENMQVIGNTILIPPLP